MSDAVVVAIIGAIPASLTLVLSMAVVFHAWHVPSKLNELVEHTNSLTDKLVEKTDIAGIATGIAQEKARQQGTDADATAIAILAAAQIGSDKVLADAQVGADKVLAAAKLAAEQILAAAKLAKEGDH